MGRYLIPIQEWITDIDSAFKKYVPDTEVTVKWDMGTSDVIVYTEQKPEPVTETEVAEVEPKSSKKKGRRS